MAPCQPAGPLSVSKLPGGQGLSIGYQQGIYSLNVELERDPAAGVGQPVAPTTYSNAMVVRWPTSVVQACRANQVLVLILILIVQLNSSCSVGLQIRNLYRPMGLLHGYSCS
jgi:hypothetical protein